MKIFLNPENYNQDYLKYLNECFPNWGDEKTYNWAFNRKFNTFLSDFFIIKSEENQVLSGSAISYRTLKIYDKSYQIGIMTGSWTLPLSRGMGCFTETIKKSSEIVANKKMPFLTAFVTESNASYRRLRDAGSLLINTNYIISQNLDKSKLSNLETAAIIEKTEENLKYIYAQREEILKDKIHFDYDYNDFINQFVNRVNPTILLKIANEYAIIEETSKMFQLHYSSNYSFAIISKIVDWANNQGKEIIFFSTDKVHEFNNLESFKIVPGFFTILPNQASINLNMSAIFENTKFDIQYGDKM